MNDGSRRDAQSILRAVQRRGKSNGHGKLRVFLGMCPGVGKTYAMLKAAREQQEHGVKVAVGVVETHGRKDTEALLPGLKVFPRQRLEYRESVLEEMNLDMILKEKPELVLVDELAHTNAPGSRHTRRFQDVEEILASGIDVYTTLNIQHLESRKDQVAQITGVLVRETVPDSFLDLANQIQLIDLSPSDLLFRLKEGKVYLGERADAAAKGFFKEESITALRELALRFTAEWVDQDLSEQMIIKGIEGPWNTGERLLVAASYSPYSERLIRATRRMAYALDAPWIALYIETGQTLRDEDLKTLRKNLSLARELGAEVITFADTSLKRGIQQICQDKNITQIVMGRPDRRFLRDWLGRGTLLDELVRTSSKIDVHVIRADRAPIYRGFHLRLPSLSTGFFPYYYTAWFLAIISFACYLALPYTGYRALGSVFLLSILAVAAFGKTGPIIFAAIGSALIWDYFFIPPHFTFMISSGDDYVMVLSFLVTALVAGFLTVRIRRQEEVLAGRELRARSLFDLTRNLSEAKDENFIVGLLVAAIEKMFSGTAIALLKNKQGKLVQASAKSLNEKDFAVASWAFENQKSAGWSTPTLSASPCLCLPMSGTSGVIGVLALYPSVKQKEFSIEQESYFATVINQASLAVERLRYREEAQATRLYEASERLHQTLLNSISHELRTPLTVIMGAAAVLSDKNAATAGVSTHAVGQELIQASERLNRVIENLLDMTRLNSGVLELKREWHEFDELIAANVKKLEGALQKHRLNIHIAPNLPLISVDYRLFEHALSNLILNATTYTPPGSTIEISARLLKSSPELEIIIEDNGPSIPEADREKIFAKFYRVPGTPSGGTGLGLSIVKSIVEAHAGTVRCDKSHLGGARFVIRLPVPSTPNPGAIP